MNANKLYVQALTKLYVHKDKRGARADFISGCNNWPDMCDFYRGEIASRENPIPTLTDLETLYEKREDYAYLSRAAGQSEAYPRLYWYPHDLFEIEIPLTQRASMEGAYAMALSDSGANSYAHDVLNSTIDPNHPYIRVAWAYLYRNTKRWNDLISAANTLSNTEWRDPATGATTTNKKGKPVRDKYLNILAAVLAGEACAHLSRNEDAMQVLDPASRSDYPYLSAHALYIMSLIHRQQGDYAHSHELMEKADAAGASYCIDQALEDPTLLLDVTTVKNIEARTDPWDPETEPLDDLPETLSDAQRNLLIGARDALDKQIGMEDVKLDVKTLQREIEYAEIRLARGAVVPSSSRHLILSGPPGTGKTTVARILAMIYAGYGIVKRPDVIEARRSDMIGASEGATAQMMQDVFDKARGGVLFIDEAPDMIQDREGSGTDHRGQEAVSILLQNMENHRDDTIVIIAGYEGGLNRFLKTNEGLQSRFSNWIRFHSYSPQEIADIAQLVATERNNILPPKSKNLIIEKVHHIQAGGDHSGTGLIDKLGNGRFARNIIEKAEINRVRRLSSADMSRLDSGTLATLTPNDIEKALDILITSAL